MGTYADELGYNACKMCPAGFYLPIKGAKSIKECIPCKPGTYSLTEGALSELSCYKCDTVSFLHSQFSLASLSWNIFTYLVWHHWAGIFLLIWYDIIELEYFYLFCMTSLS
jgi:hypothetical protein